MSEGGGSAYYAEGREGESLRTQRAAPSGRAASASPQRRWQLKQRELGLCEICPRPAARRGPKLLSKCEMHLERARVYSRAYRAIEVQT